MQFPTDKEDPFEVFGQWLKEAKKSDLNEPTAMCLTTCTIEGKPSSRMVLLKEFDERGFVFFTNLKSRKGLELLENPNAAICFYWDSLQKQVRVTGKVKRITDRESDIYHNSRRRGSQIGAWASMQSHKLDNYRILEERVEEIKKQFGSGPIPRPPFWGGFRLKPYEIEFWQHMEHRLHKRLLYIRKGSKWNTTLLYP